MLLSDHDILKAHDEGHIDLTPWIVFFAQNSNKYFVRTMKLLMYKLYCKEI